MREFKNVHIQKLEGLFTLLLFVVGIHHAKRITNQKKALLEKEGKDGFPEFISTPLC